MKRFLTRASVAGLSAALVAGAALVAAPAASAAQIGTLTASGLTSQTVAFTVATSGACPTTATNIQIRMFNDPSVAGNTANLANPPSSPNILGNTAGSTIAGGIYQTTGFTATPGFTLAGYAANNGLAQLGQGTYIMELFCRTNLASASLGEFQGRLVIGAGGAVTSFTPVLQNVNTTTTLAVNPTSINTLGSSTFTATVAPASGTAIAGTVQFKVDGVNFGAPVAVNSAGVATSGAYSSSVVGTKAVTAVFLGGSDANNNYATSTSNSVNLGVTQATASTTTNLVLSSSTVAYPDTVTATATVTGASTINSGTVQFLVDGANFGSPVAVNASGVAVSPAISRNAGTYSVTAVYSGAIINGVQFQTSTSPAASFQVTAPAYLPDVQNIKATIPPGTIVISTPYSCVTVACDQPGDTPLNLGNFTLNTAATVYTATGTFQDIRVADTRPGNLPWTASAISSNLTKVGVATPGVNETINAQNVGLTALALSPFTGFPAGTNVTPATFQLVNAPATYTGANLTAVNNPVPSAPVAAGASGNAGLGGSPKVVLHANSGLGTTNVNGTLTIIAPTNTLDGVYTGTITFTVIGS